MALMSSKANATQTVPALVAALELETNNSIGGVFSALGYYGTNAKAAVPLLVKIIESPKPSAWSLNPALTALRKIDPAAARPFIEKLENNTSRSAIIASNDLMMPATTNTNAPRMFPH
jgi:hypothetical protein